MKEILRQIDALYGGAKDKTLIEVEEDAPDGRGGTFKSKGWRLLDVQS